MKEGSESYPFSIKFITMKLIYKDELTLVGSTNYIHSRGKTPSYIKVTGFRNKISRRSIDRCLEIAGLRIENEEKPLQYEKALYNAIYDRHPELAMEIQGTNFDPWRVNINVVELLMLINDD